MSLHLRGPCIRTPYGLTSAFKSLPGAPLDPIQQAMNAAMSAVRIGVEHGIEKTMMLWSFNGFKHNRGAQTAFILFSMVLD
jgi:hypothetical protein